MPPLNDSCSCIEPSLYSGQICADFLMSVQACYSDSITTSPHIASTIDQEQAERDILKGLLLLNPAPECFEEVLAFFCLHTFMLCDSNGTLHTPTREGCLAMKNGTCSTEWEKASFLPSNSCENLPDTSDECATNMFSFITNTSSTLFNQPLMCSDGFYFDENGTGLCRPECGLFERSDDGLTIFENLCLCIGFIFSIVMISLALTLQRKSLLNFPAVIQVYLCGTILVATTVALPGIFDNTRLFCSSRDQIQAFSDGNQSLYCQITAIVFHYCTVQVTYWVMFHAIFLFWAIKFPFSYRQLRLSGKMRRAHIFVVLLTLLLPLPGALGLLYDGFLSVRNPSPTCLGNSTEYAYFSFSLPVSLTLGIAACLLLLTFWTILKEFVVKDLDAGKIVRRAGQAQVKISLALVYYTIMGVMGLASAMNYFTSIRDDIKFLFLCESTGSKNCKVDLSTYYNFRILNIVTVIMVSLVPVVATVFSINFKVCTQTRRRKHV